MMFLLQCAQDVLLRHEKHVDPVIEQYEVGSL